MNERKGEIDLAAICFFFLLLLLGTKCILQLVQPSVEYKDIKPMICHTQTLPEYARIVTLGQSPSPYIHQTQSRLQCLSCHYPTDTLGVLLR